MKKKYPLSLFVTGFITNVIFRYFILFVLGIILMIAGIFVDWCRYAGISLLLFDIIISFIVQMQNRHIMLEETDNEQFSQFQNAVLKDENVIDNIKEIIKNNVQDM